MLRASIISSCIFCVACGSDDGDGRSAANLSDRDLGDQVTAKIKSCDVYFAPQDPKDDTVQDEFDRCVARCILEEADCSTLQALQCGEELTVANPFYDCARLCPPEPEDGFVCRDFEKIPFGLVCDGERDCGKAEDEENCEPYVCDDGEEIVGKGLRCDNIADCADNSDEEDCPFSC